MICKIPQIFFLYKNIFLMERKKVKMRCAYKLFTTRIQKYTHSKPLQTISKRYLQMIRITWVKSHTKVYKLIDLSIDVIAIDDNRSVWIVTPIYMTPGLSITSNLFLDNILPTYIVECKQLSFKITVRKHSSWMLTEIIHNALLLSTSPFSNCWFSWFWTD